jgi:hypothetical protein
VIASGSGSGGQGRSESPWALSRRQSPVRVPARDDGKLVPHEAEQEAIREIVAMRLQGKALWAIAEEGGFRREVQPRRSIGSSTKSRVSHSERRPSARFPGDEDGSARRNIEPLQCRWGLHFAPELREAASKGHRISHEGVASVLRAAGKR